MSQRPLAAPPEASRPGLFDHVAILAGAALSLYLMRIAPLRAVSTNTLDPRLDQVFRFLILFVRLPEGIVLLWPVFFALQWFSRSEGLAMGEWLWLFSWVGVMILAVLAGLTTLPESYQPESLPLYASKLRVLWYLLVTPALAVLALLVLLVDLFRSYVPPWTHQLALALLLWPAPGAVVILFGGKLEPEMSEWL
jgi:hypothetical protein